jgi:short subunit dehydrogenase-like uncharacterized protein
MRNIWILGGAGRAGRAIARELVMSGLPVTLVGRDAGTLRNVATSLKLDSGIVASSSLTDMAAQITRAKPSVVINTIGPFTKTAIFFVNACPPGTHYLDIGNELPQFLALFGMHKEFVRTSRTVIPGAGWGVLGTESAVRKLCDGQPVPVRVRVDSLAAAEGGLPLGRTLAETIVEGIRYGGRRYIAGSLRSCLAGSDQEIVTLPDGTAAKSASIASGELEAARRASKAPNVVACLEAAPGGPIRFVIPLIAALVAIPAIRHLAIKKLASLVPPPSSRKESWARARVEWADGTTRTVWLRAGEGYDFLAKAAAAVARQLVEGKATPGCFTPGTLLGTDFGIEAGGEFLVR